jgi:hypothetical protein
VEVDMPTAAPADTASRLPTHPIAVALAAAAIATVLVALWLVFTAVTILPVHDPAHVRMWLGVAAGFLVFALTTAAALREGRVGATARLVNAVLGVVAAGLGIGTAVRVLSGAGHFEGYLVLMALVLSVHGLLALLHAFLVTGPARA